MAEKAEGANKPSLEKLKALQLAMDKIEKDHGKGTIMKMGDNKVEDVAVISTGSIGLNVALGVNAGSDFLARSAASFLSSARDFLRYVMAFL